MNKNILAFSATAVGYNHIKVNKICEDASDWYSDDKMSICVVADGHGSDNYPRTDRGSRFAVDAAIKCIIDFVNVAESDEVLNDEKNNYRLMLQLSASILKNWHYAIEKDYENNPFTEMELEKVSERYKKRFLATDIKEQKIEKAYGCTLIAYVVTAKYSFGLQIGDGKCVYVNRNGDFSEPIPWDEDCQMNVTTSICDDNAIEEFRFAISEQRPIAVFCGTDGIDDSYATSEELYALYRSILKIFIEYGNEVGKKEIEEYLPVLTKRGSGDDVSIGLIVDSQGIKNIAPVFDMQGELFELLSKLKEQKHQMNVISEKDVALCKKIRAWMDAGKKSPDGMDNVYKVNELRGDKEKLEFEIDETEKKITSLEQAISSFLFDVEVSSFDVTIETMESEVSEEEKLQYTEEISIVNSAEETEVVEESVCEIESVSNTISCEKD